MRSLALMIACLLPATAQAIVVTPYAPVALQCSSVKLCDKTGVCTDHTGAAARLSMGQDTFATRLYIGGDKFDDWQRRVDVSMTSGWKTSPQSTYRQMSMVPKIDRMWKTAHKDERRNGWIGPKMPPLERNFQQAEAGIYRLYHTRTIPNPEPKPFQSNKREIIVFDCTMETL
ncbi:MAG: hypothetical protein JXR15_12355 [Shimia sp.]|uniref:hypothetical protein n=1 Tax=Shimia sp. TaxID=1954381 RepID=UPI003B8B9CFF